MATVTTWMDVYLNKPVKVQYLNGNLFTADNNAHKVGVKVYNTVGSAASLSGTVSADIVRSDGVTVTESGTLSGNQCSVTVPAAAYASPGNVIIAIKLTSGSTVTTLGVFACPIYDSMPGAIIDPATIIPSIEELIVAIDTAVASIPVDYSGLWTTLAPAFSDQTAYAAGQYATRNGALYRFTSNHSAGSWTGTDAVSVKVGGELTDLKSAFMQETEHINGEVFRYSNDLCEKYNSNTTTYVYISIARKTYKNQILELSSSISDLVWNVRLNSYSGTLVKPMGNETKWVIDADYTDTLVCIIRKSDSSAWDGDEYKEIRVKLYNPVSNVLNNTKTVDGNGLAKEIDGYVKGFYINTSGSTVDITSPVASQSENMRYVVLDCSPDDIFTLSVVGGSVGRAYCFIDSSGNVIKNANASETINGKIIAPASSSKLIINDIWDGSSESYIGVPFGERLTKLEKEVINDIPIISGIFQRSTAEYERNTTFMTSYTTISLSTGDTIRLSSNDNTMGFMVIKFDGTYWTIIRAFGTDDYVATKDETVRVNIRNSTSSNLTSSNVKDIRLLLIRKSENRFIGSASERLYFSVTANSHAFVNNPETDSDSNADSEAYVIQNAVLSLPSNYDKNETAKPVPIVMMCHGFAGNVSYNKWYSNDEDFLALVTALTSNGYAVFDVADTSNSDTGSVCDLGCPQLLEAYYKAFEYIRRNYNVQDKCLIYGMSHGTYTTLNMISEFGNIVKAACVGGAVVSYYYYFIFNSGTFAPQIARKFGFVDQTGATYEADKMIPYDNYANVLSINDKNYLFGKYPPIKILLGGDDNADMNGKDETVFGAIKNAGNLVYLRTVDGFNHHNITTSNSSGLRSEVVDFFDRYK